MGHIGQKSSIKSNMALISKLNSLLNALVSQPPNGSLQTGAVVSVAHHNTPQSNEKKKKTDFLIGLNGAFHFIFEF